MTVTLSAKQQAFVDEQVASGRFPDVDAVLDEALRMLAQKEDEAKLAALKADIQVGLDDIAAGRVTRGPINARQMLEEIRQKRASS